MSKQLLIGCGSARDKRISLDENPEWGELTTLDFNSIHNPDVVHDLTDTPYPFEESSFDEIHAYEVLEHISAQGDYLNFFAQFEEFYRLLKPDGLFCATVPWWQGRWSWADPGHSRTITPDTLAFLSQSTYDMVGKTAISDYRFCYQGNFERVFGQRARGGGVDEGEDADFGAPDHFVFILKAVKPGADVVNMDQYRPAST